jgi:hypothetical protein
MKTEPSHPIRIEKKRERRKNPKHTKHHLEAYECVNEDNDSFETDIDRPDRLLADVLLLVGSVGHLAEFILFSELARKDAEVLDQGLAGVDYRLAGGDFTIGLATQDEVRGQGVRDL